MDLKDIWNKWYWVRYITMLVLILFIIANAAYCFLGGAVIVGLADLGCFIPLIKYGQEWLKIE